MSGNMQSLSAASYTSIQDRGAAKNLDKVREELGKVANALPTQIRPEERTAYLDGLLDDLDNAEEAPWTSWPDDIYLLALTAIKTLGRNPVGSETLLDTAHLDILLFHTSLPRQPLPSPPARDRPAPLSPPARDRPAPLSPPALEALRILANLLVLHPGGRKAFARAGGAISVAKALAGKNWDGDLEVELEVPDRLFLLARVGFLVTVDRTEAVEIMVEREDVVDSLAYHLASTPPVQANFPALAEVLKMANNIVRFLPKKAGSSSSQGEDGWDGRLEPLVWPTVSLLHRIPFSDLSPPLAQVIHLLLSIPLSSHLLPIWHSLPERSPTASAAQTSVRSLLSRFSNMSTSTVHNVYPRKSSADSTSSGHSAAPPAASSTPSPTTRPNERAIQAAAGKSDATALGARLYSILETYCSTWLPGTKSPDQDLPKGLALDEQLPPLLLLIARVCDGSDPSRSYFRKALLPPDLDRSAAAGSLESRSGVLGTVLRLMQSSSHHHSRDSAGEMMWAVCGSDATELCAEIGYGNAAGLLFQKGITQPPPGRITELPPAPTNKPLPPSPSPRSAPTSPSRGGKKTERHPITALQDREGPPLSDMTQEEKEREAERLFVLFERMERNPVISMKSDDQGGKKVGVNDIMKSKLDSGELDQWEKKDAEGEAKRKEEQDEKDEEEALKEIEAYRKRMGKK